MERRCRAMVFLLAMLLVVPSGGVFAQPLEPLDPPPLPEVDSLIDATPELWFVELSGPPAAAGGNRAAVRAEHDAFRAAAAAQGIQFRERFAYDTLWNGLSIAVAPQRLKELAALPGVKALYPVLRLEVPDTATVSPDLATALAMTGADVAQNELGLTGEGIRVAVMDTGIDYDHPDLGGCFGPGCRVEVGWDFVGDDFNADPTSPSYNPIPEPDPDPDDCQGHGTHVAGIIGADGEVTGVAPGVTFGAYRVFGCDGSTTTDIMIAAMEMALADGMDVLNMSIGSDFGWAQDPVSVASDRLVEQGMVVVASIGNSGASGIYSAGAPGVGEKVIGVASFDNTHVALNTFTISPDDTPIGYGVAASAPLPPTEGTYPLARTGTATTPDDACDPLPEGSLEGSVALIRRGTCTFHQKALNAQNAGAVGVVLYNNVPGRFSPTVAGDPAITIPVVAISDTEGALIDGRLAGGPVDLTWTDEQGIFENPTAGLISSFSAYGPAPDLGLKPDIGAPGGLIRSTYPLEQGGYATISGTSMSAPHVAGAVALLLEARPGSSPETVATLLRNTANPAVWWGNPGLGLLDNVHRQGAGMLDIPGAVLATTRVEPSKIALGESGGGPSRVTLTIHNDGDATVTYHVYNEDALATTGDAFTPGFWFEPAGVTFDATKVTVRPGGRARVRVEIAPPVELPEGGVYGGYLVVKSSADGSEFRVPYAGFKGDYQALTALDDLELGLPWLGRPNVLEPVGDGEVYTMVGDDIPAVIVHLHHQTRFLRIQVRSAPDGRNWGDIYDLALLPRNAAPGEVFVLDWDGLVPVGNSGTWREAPDGDYVMILTVGKALTSGNNPASVETWTSPVFTIDRSAGEDSAAGTAEEDSGGSGGGE